MTPVTVGLLLAIPFVAITSSPSCGRFVRRLGLLMTPEEHDPPDVLLRANALGTGGRDISAPIVRLMRDPDLLGIHRAMLRPRPHRRGEVDVALVVGLARLDEFDTLAEALQGLTRRELAAVLGDKRGLDHLMRLADS
jgi:membrane glycosyltransferase